MSLLNRIIPGRNKEQSGGNSVQQNGGGTVGVDAGTHVNIVAGARSMSTEQVLAGASQALQGHNIGATLAFISPDTATGISPLVVIARQRGYTQEMVDGITDVALNQTFGLMTPLVEDMQLQLARRQEEEEAARLAAQWDALPRAVRVRKQAWDLTVRSVKNALRPFTVGAEVSRLSSFDADDEF